MEAIAFYSPCFCLSNRVWHGQIILCTVVIYPNYFKCLGTIFALFWLQKTHYFLERTHQILTPSNVSAARCRLLEAKLDNEDQHYSIPKSTGNLTKMFCIFCPHVAGYNFNWLWFIAWNNWKRGKFWYLSSIWPWRSMSFAVQNNNQIVLHLGSKFGDPTLNRWWVISRTIKGLTHTHGHTQTDRRSQRQYLEDKTGLG